MRNSVIVNKMLEYIDKVQGYIIGIDEQAFYSNTMLLEACVFNLSQLGELVRHLDDEFKAGHPEIPWAKISGLRHHIVHDYEGIVASLIWDTIVNNLPELKKQLTSISN